MIDSETLYSLLAEIANGIPPERSAITSTPEIEAMRVTLAQEVADIRGKGNEIDVPN